MVYYFVSFLYRVYIVINCTSSWDNSRMKSFTLKYWCLLYRTTQLHIQKV